MNTAVSRRRGGATIPRAAGPDSRFPALRGRPAGKRKNYFDTTATTHPLDDPCYIVEPQPLGTRLPPSGLPVFTLNYTNDDAADRQLGTDSRLTFTAPAAGEYLVRVRDARARAARGTCIGWWCGRASPISTSRSAAPADGRPGSGKAFTLVVERIDGFDGPI